MYSVLKMINCLNFLPLVGALGVPYGTFHNIVNDIARSTGGQRGDRRRSGTRWPFDGQRKPFDSHHYVMFTLV